MSQSKPSNTKPTVTHAAIEVHRRPVNSLDTRNQSDPDVTEFHPESDEPQINAAEIGLRKRYPGPTGFSINERSTMICNIRSGRGWIEWLEDGEPKSVPIQAGDIVRVPNGMKYAWQPQRPSNLSLLIISQPPWTPEQQQIVEE
jgi:mannose-6-phosphate isomerase-like protein (cupin superfamily)